MRPERELIRHQPGESLHAFRRREASFPAHLHVHGEYELTLITRGHGLCLVGDAVRPYTAPDLVLLGPELPHTWQSLGPGPQEAVVLQWQASAVPGLGLPEGQAIAALLERGRAGLWLLCDTGLAASLEGLLDCTGYARLLAFAALLARCSELPGRILATAPRWQTDARLAGFLAWLQRHQSEPLALGDAAAHLRLGREAAARFIRRQSGSTFTGLLHRLRIAAACERLASSSERIVDIAFAVGFGNLSHFNRCFRRHVGLTPRDWRRRFGAA